MDVHLTKNVSIGIDPYPYIHIIKKYQCNMYPYDKRFIISWLHWSLIFSTLGPSAQWLSQACSDATLETWLVSNDPNKMLWENHLEQINHQ